MIKLIELFLFILSVIFILKYVLEFVMTLKEDDPEPMKINPIEKIALYLTISYFFTAILGTIFGLI